MNRIILSLMLCALLLAASDHNANPRPTAFDVARILTESGGSINEETINRLFEGAFEANMRIPPAHMGVVFFDRRTGRELEHQKVRELIGPVRQDGTEELLRMAASIAGDRLPLEVDQLILLMDAAFIASMRVPPDHIDIEFYDRRHGPSGQPGGGVSGRVPDELTRSPLETAVQEPDPYGALPETVEELVDRMAKIGLKAPPRADMVTFVMPLLGSDAASREQEMRELNAFLQNEGVFVAQRGDRATERLPDGTTILYQVVYLQGEPEAIEMLREELAPLQ